MNLPLLEFARRGTKDALAGELPCGALHGGGDIHPFGLGMNVIAQRVEEDSSRFGDLCRIRVDPDPATRIGSFA